MSAEEQMERMAARLEERARGARFSEQARLTGKAEGVRLAMSMLPSAGPVDWDDAEREAARTLERWHQLRLAADLEGEAALQLSRAEAARTSRDGWEEAKNAGEERGVLMWHKFHGQSQGHLSAHRRLKNQAARAREEAEG